MRTEELLDWLGRWHIRSACGSGAQELEEFVSVFGEEGVQRMADDVGVSVLAEDESNGHAARAGVRGVVRNLGHRGAIRESDGHRR